MPLLAAIFLLSQAPPSFAVTSIRPSAAQVKFEHDGKTQTSPLGLKMRDVTVATCIKFAYDVQDSQINGPDWLQNDHFDIQAKSDTPVRIDQLKAMLRSLLADRFQLTFHRQPKQMRAYVMTVLTGARKLTESAPDAEPSRENSATGTVAHALTMAEFANFIAGPLQTPVVDQTGLASRYDFVLDFTPYLPPEAAVMRPDYADTNGIILSALRGELGLKLESKKEVVEVLVIDRVTRPSAN